MRSSEKRSRTPSKIIVASVWPAARDAHVVDRAEVLLAAVEVRRDRQAVAEVGGVDQVAGAPDVEDDGDPASCACAQTGSRPR